MGKRYKMGGAASRRDFSRKADRIHHKNGMGTVSRGGIRL